MCAFLTKNVLLEGISDLLTLWHQYWACLFISKRQKTVAAATWLNQACEWPIFGTKCRIWNFKLSAWQFSRRVLSDRGWNSKCFSNLRDCQVPAPGSIPYIYSLYSLQMQTQPPRIAVPCPHPHRGSAWRPQRGIAGAWGCTLQDTEHHSWITAFKADSVLTLIIHICF